MSKLYPISPPQIILADFLPKLREVLSAAQAPYFQLRLKGVSHEEIVEAAKAIIPICHKYGIKFIINDSADIARETNADGVHIGGDDGDVAEVRKKIGDKILGVSCYDSIELAKAAEAAGADYVSFGAFYPTSTKVAKSKAEIETILKWKSISKLPCSAIGGITPYNAGPVIAAGADYICAISYLWQGDSSTAVREFSGLV